MPRPSIVTNGQEGPGITVCRGPPSGGYRNGACESGGEGDLSKPTLACLRAKAERDPRGQGGRGADEGRGTILDASRRIEVVLEVVMREGFGGTRVDEWVADYARNFDGSWFSIDRSSACSLGGGVHDERRERG